MCPADCRVTAYAIVYLCLGYRLDTTVIMALLAEGRQPRGVTWLPGLATSSH